MKGNLSYLTWKEMDDLLVGSWSSYNGSLIFHQENEIYNIRLGTLQIGMNVLILMTVLNSIWLLTYKYFYFTLFSYNLFWSYCSPSPSLPRSYKNPSPPNFLLSLHFPLILFQTGTHTLIHLIHTYMCTSTHTCAHKRRETEETKQKWYKKNKQTNKNTKKPVCFVLVNCSWHGACSGVWFINSDPLLSDNNFFSPSRSPL